MAVIKVFTPSGVKTVEMLGNVDDMPYDTIEDESLLPEFDIDEDE